MLAMSLTSELSDSRSNRRKQHKPLRVQEGSNFSTSNDDNGNKTSITISSDKAISAENNFPTKYHQRGSELQFADPTLASTELIKPEYSSNNNLTATDLSLGANDGSDTSKGDAVCELCNEQFCNNYFLKNHMSDRHNVAMVETDFDFAETNLLPKEDKVETNLSANRDSSDTLNTNATAGNEQNNTPSSFGLQSSLDADSKDLSSAGNFSVASSGRLVGEGSEKRQVGSAGEMEDFCEFCQKRFCNKYYLRKHKLDVHGLSSDAGSSGRKRTLPPSGSIGNGLPGANFPLPDVNPLANLMLMNPFAAADPLGLPPTLFPPGSDIAANALASSILAATSAMSSSATASLPGLPGSTTSSSSGSKDGFCDICKIDFQDNYFLKIHQVSTHSLPPDDLMTAGLVDMMALSSKLANPLFNGGDKMQMESFEQLMAKFNAPMLDSQRNAVDQEGKSLMPPMDFTAFDGVMANIFGNSVRAADRVVCDICNKEVCNKYFLKTHKLKVHGIDTGSTFTGSENDENSRPKLPAVVGDGLVSSLGDSRIQDMAHMSFTNQDLLRMGIDPEAYCDICKKEFSSKYFLRTHRANIHGLSADRTPTKLGVGDEAAMKVTMEAAVVDGAKSTPDGKTDHSVAHPVAALAHPVVGLAGDELADALGIYRKKSRKSAYATRVTCDVCGREVCNKYFLKTHMLKKHGMIYNPPVSAALFGDLGQDSDASTNSTGLDAFTSEASKFSSSRGDVDVAALQINLSGRPDEVNANEKSAAVAIKREDSQAHNEITRETHRHGAHDASPSGNSLQLHSADGKNNNGGIVNGSLASRAHTIEDRRMRHKLEKRHLKRLAAGMNRMITNGGTGQLNYRSASNNLMQNGSHPVVCPSAIVKDSSVRAEDVVMQEFTIDQLPCQESGDNGIPQLNDAILKSLIRLPVRHKLSAPIRVSFLLTPVVDEAPSSADRKPGPLDDNPCSPADIKSFLPENKPNAPDSETNKSLSPNSKPYHTSSDNDIDMKEVANVSF